MITFTERRLRLSMAVVGMIFDPNILLKADDVFLPDTTIVFPAGKETLFSFDVPETSLIPGFRYSAYFTILDISDPEIEK